MGMYTEFVFGCSLKEDTPGWVIEILKVVFGLQKHLPEKYEDQSENFPPTRGMAIPFGSSYYFGTSNPHSKMERDSLDKRWLIYIRCNIKNCENEIEGFINWIMPYVDSGSGTKEFLGYTLYEESEHPVLYYKGDDAAITRQAREDVLEILDVELQASKSRIESSAMGQPLSERSRGEIIGLLEAREKIESLRGSP